MPSAAARRLYEDQIPSFMSVFDLDAETMSDQGTVTVLDAKFMGLEAPKFPTDSQPQLRSAAALAADAAHRHHDSTSTQATESAESSPTTTASCTDSSPLSDPSPSSSPDSPVNLAPLQTFGPASFNGLGGIASLTVSETTLERPMTSPAPRRPKNMKGLSIQPPFNSLSSTLVSEPSSPSFIKPTIPAMKRKPSQLSLNTGSNELRNRPILEMPSSPSVPSMPSMPPMPPIHQRRALKHSTSSPHMLSSLKSATFGPVGGMTIPTVLERNETGLSEMLRPLKSSMSNNFDSTILEEESPIKMQIASRAAYEFEPFHEIENNEDQKTPGYPDGPIAIYSDNVYLYLEPSAEEASRFDVVINVAREVNNPFEYCSSSGKKAADARDNKPSDKSGEFSPVPDTAVSTASFATAFEFLPDEGSERTPTTPKPPSSFNEPEYIHVLWDHNTDIGQDLMMLCETIERKTKEGKKVLVHCQQGASRSASLIIAYGMYQNPELSVNDAYYAVQAKSQWVSPNMRLMYCLQDFQKEVSKKKLSPNAGFRPRSGRSPTKHRMTLSADNIDVPSKEPLTAPLPVEEGAGMSGSPETSPTHPRGNSSPNRGEPISPGPSSAPSSFSWTEREGENEPAKFPRFNIDSVASSSHSQLGSDFGSSNSSSQQLPMSPGFAPPALSLPPLSPGFSPFSSPAKPPPSPGFGAHRFGGSMKDTFRIGSLNLAAMAQPELSEKPPAEPKPAMERQIKVMRSFPSDMALMSPRAETMTNNPLREAASFVRPPPVPAAAAAANNFSGMQGMQFVEVPPTPTDGLFSPRETVFPRHPFFPFGRPTQTADPRSPPTKGETPIVRSIDELL